LLPDRSIRWEYFGFKLVPGFDSYYYIAVSQKYCYQSIDPVGIRFQARSRIWFIYCYYFARFQKYCYQIDRSVGIRFQLVPGFDSYLLRAVSQSIATRSIDPVGILLVSSSFPDLIHIVLRAVSQKYCYQIDRSSRYFWFQLVRGFDSLLLLLRSVSQSIATRSIDPVGILFGFNSFPDLVLIIVLRSVSQSDCYQIDRSSRNTFGFNSFKFVLCWKFNLIGPLLLDRVLKTQSNNTKTKRLKTLMEYTVPKYRRYFNRRYPSRWDATTDLDDIVHSRYWPGRYETIRYYNTLHS
jgi:hypothetical protein